MKLVLVGGNGKWGQKYVSTLLTQFENFEFKIADRNNWKSLIDELPDGVIVCTQPSSHIEIASYSLSKNIPTMIEKPLSLSLMEAEKLKQFTAPILVDHIHLFSDSYQYLKECIQGKPITKISSIGSNKGPIRYYTGLWDYGCHDLSMILDLTNQYPSDIKVNARPTETGCLFDIKLQFENFVSESTVGNGGIEPIRKFTVNCNGLELEYDDKKRPPYHNPPLKNAIKVFIDVINGKSDSRVGLDLSLNVIKILEYCQNEVVKSLI
jgi:predicted dehydrogenase